MQPDDYYPSKDPKQSKHFVGDLRLEQDLVISGSRIKAAPKQRPVRRSYKHKRCGNVSPLAEDVAKTFAENPKAYGSLYCNACRSHYPVHEYEWPDGTVVGL